MNAQNMAKKAYSMTTETGRSSRASEYEAIARITYELKAAAINKELDYERFANAIHKNNQLWSTLAASVVDAENELSATVRAQIFYLSEFSRRHAAQVLAGVASVAPLLEINTSILKGLRQGKGM